jgi:hypothetical protein
MAKEYTSDELAKWLLEKAEEAKRPDIARKFIMSNDQRGADSAITGKLYFFKYDPKGKLILPKYDKFPMCFPIEQKSDGFIGLNLHYLGAGAREGFVNRLMVFKNNKYGDDRARLRLSYDLIKSTPVINQLAPVCIKRYLYTRVRSRFIEIYPDEYDKAIQLPVENWVFNQ